MRITTAASQVMEALWARSPWTADEIVAEVRGREQWGEATVKTLIHRLLKKKAIRSAREAGRHQYHPLIQRADYVQAESKGLVDRLFGGEVAPMVAHFAEHKALTPKDIQLLKKLIADLEDE